MGQSRRMLDDMFSLSSLVAENCELVGNVTASGAFVLNGNIVGDGVIEGLLHINVSGNWEGNIQAEDMVIEGKVIGNVFTAGKLEVAGTAVIRGNIYGKQVAVNKGADIMGDMKVADDANVKYFEEKRKQEAKI